MRIANLIVIVAIASTTFYLGYRLRPKAALREYQVEITTDSTYIYDGYRLVGVLPYDSTQSFDKLMLKDNL